MGVAQLMTAGHTLSGKWRKDRSASQGDCYSRQLDLLGLQGIQKACAEKLINGLHIDELEDGMRVAFKVDRVPFYKHTEEFRLNQAVSMGRRDKKGGQQHATLRKIPAGVQVHIQLDAPDAGSIRETYICKGDGVLEVESVTTVGDREETCVQVYRKQ